MKPRTRLALEQLNSLQIQRSYDCDIKKASPAYAYWMCAILSFEAIVCRVSPASTRLTGELFSKA